MKIDLRGADNARDFSGITLPGDIKIGKGRMIRSNHLSSATPEDVKLLKEYDLRLIIDLRTETEAMQKPDVEIPGVEYINIPVFVESTIGITHENGTDKHALGELEIPDMCLLYKKMVRDEFSKSQIKKIMSRIFVQDKGTVLWHCSEGKDRCGMISALVLLLLGVDKDDVLKDYLYTNNAAEKRSQAYYENVIALTGDSEKAGRVRDAFLAKEEYFNSAISYIFESYGDIDSYFVEGLGFSKEEIVTFRNTMIKKFTLDSQFDFFRELDKEKFIGRQTYLTDGIRKENDAEHAWHMSVMALILKDYANEEIDLLKTISMILMHDVVEIDAGDTYAYDEVNKKTQAEREMKAAERLYGMLPKEQAEYFMKLWLEFEEQKTPEARFARTMDNIQPMMLNDATDGRAWLEHQVKKSQIMKRNEKTIDGSEVLWDYAKENFIDKNIRKGRIKEEKM